MITNDVQLRTAATYVRRLRGLLDELRERPLEGAAWGERGRALEIRTVQGQIDEYESEIEEYEGLKRGDVAVTDVVLEELEELPLQLIRARIALGLSQKKLARLLSMKEQQVQRYEASRYSTASLKRLVEIATVLEEERAGQVDSASDVAEGETHEPAVVAPSRAESRRGARVGGR